MSFFFLHGMGGSPDDWAELQKIIPGEACTIPPGNSFAEIVSTLADRIRFPSETVLCGYSMGGRVAVLLARELKKRGTPPAGLALLAAGLGFPGQQERAERRASDEKWAVLASQDSEKFWREWYAQPLFASLERLSEARFGHWLNSRKSLDISTLITQLRQLGPAEHEYLLPLLRELVEEGISVLYLAGELDKKYLTLGQALAEDLGVNLGIVPGAGHILPLEAPEIVAELLGNFFRSAK